MSGGSCAEAEVSTVGAAPTNRCRRCDCYLRAGNDGELCDPCRLVVASCLPFLPAAPLELAPPGVDLVRLVAGVMLVHDALHPGEKLYVREALARYGVAVDNIDTRQAAGKLRRRHGLVLAGDPRRPGYRVVEWRRYPAEKRVDDQE